MEHSKIHDGKISIKICSICSASYFARDPMAEGSEAHGFPQGLVSLRLCQATYQFHNTENVKDRSPSAI
jgi:hypothetical protein